MSISKHALRYDAMMMMIGCNTSQPTLISSSSPVPSGTGLGVPERTNPFRRALEEEEEEEDDDDPPPRDGCPVLVAF